MPQRQPRDRKRDRSSFTRVADPPLGPSSSAILPVEVLARVLEWTPERAWLQLRPLGRKWWSAVTCLMEGELTAKTYPDGVSKLSFGMPQSWGQVIVPQVRRRGVVAAPLSDRCRFRLLLVCAPSMPAEVLHGISSIHLSNSSLVLIDGMGELSKQELMLLAKYFPKLRNYSARK